mmetsp:Transcript_17323/g.2866  ORF Transcript_17323/g.2866 Transcript_17323/m.2866 type:complete len:94 (+) Transcript_17323:79-360(+)
MVKELKIMLMETHIEANFLKVKQRVLEYTSENKEVFILDFGKMEIDRVEDSLLVKSLHIKESGLKRNLMVGEDLNGEMEIGMKEIGNMGRDKD